jgi:hypothetical protein
MGERIGRRPGVRPRECLFYLGKLPRSGEIAGDWRETMLYNLMVTGAWRGTRLLHLDRAHDQLC